MDAKRQKYKLLTKVKIHRQRKGLTACRENCGLCDLEKFYIISRPEQANLNQRIELTTPFRYRKKTLTPQQMS